MTPHALSLVREALERGIMGISEVYKELLIKVEKFEAGMQITCDNKSISTDPEGKWMRKLTYLSKVALQQGVVFLEESG
jgi:hypothetical protein